jgi:purine-nucleoside phosphorylase
VLVAAHSGMRALGLSAITDMCLPDCLKAADIHEILAWAAVAEPKLRAIVHGILKAEAAGL